MRRGTLRLPEGPGEVTPTRRRMSRRWWHPAGGVPPAGYVSAGRLRMATPISGSGSPVMIPSTPRNCQLAETVVAPESPANPTVSLGSLGGGQAGTGEAPR
ncbi:hypothetical protein [Micromonospora sp. DT47]|uniref:hypothetical protein n=1 Tax=Micromonospora sp. DT47 TaxID=3393431 RepID=UPI003CEB8F75